MRAILVAFTATLPGVLAGGSPIQRCLLKNIMEGNTQRCLGTMRQWDGVGRVDSAETRIRERGSRMSEILSSTFVLAVADLNASVGFYVNDLGFTEDLRVEGWAFLSRGACRLRLGHCRDVIPMNDVPDHSWFAYLHVRDVADLYREYVQRGVGIWHPLADKPWGMREFSIVTPDGHRIVYGEELAAAKPSVATETAPEGIVTRPS